MVCWPRRSTDPIAITPDRKKRPHQLNMYTYAVNNPLIFIDPLGLDVRLANDTEEGRKRALALATRNLTKAEAANIGIRKRSDGKFEAYIKDPKAIAMGKASEGYRHLNALIQDTSIVANVGVVGNGQTATFENAGTVKSYSGGGGIFDVRNAGPGRTEVDIIVDSNQPLSVKVMGPDGQETTGPSPDYATLAHELYGETLQYRKGHEHLQNNPQANNDIVIKIDNKFRQMNGLPPRTGSDHGGQVIIVKP